MSPTPDDLRRLIDYLAAQGCSRYQIDEALLRMSPEHRDLIVSLRPEEETP